MCVTFKGADVQILACDLHLLFAITPIENVEMAVVKWPTLHRIVGFCVCNLVHGLQFDKMSAAERRVLTAIGIDEGFVVSQASSAASYRSNAEELKVCSSSSIVTHL